MYNYINTTSQHETSSPARCLFVRFFVGNGQKRPECGIWHLVHMRPFRFFDTSTATTMMDAFPLSSAAINSDLWVQRGVFLVLFSVFFTCFRFFLVSVDLSLIFTLFFFSARSSRRQLVAGMTPFLIILFLVCYSSMINPSVHPPEYYSIDCQCRGALKQYPFQVKLDQHKEIYC